MSQNEERTSISSPRRFVRGVRLVGNWAGLVAETLGFTGLAIGILLQLWDVICRNIGLESLDPPWSVDASSVALILGALIYVAATRQHLGFTGIAEVLHNQTLKRRLKYVTDPLVAGLLIFLAYYGVLLVKDQVKFGGSYSVSFYSPLWLFYAAFPLMCVLAAIRWITRPVVEDDDEVTPIDV